MKLRYLLWLALLLIGAGYFGPWVWHKAAGLNLSADDLGEWTKFLPAWKAGQLPVLRELFYLPIWLTAIGLGLMAGRLKAWLWKIVVLIVALILVFTPLPKYPELLSAYREPEFMLTFWATVVALLLTVFFTSFGARLPNRVEAILWILIGIAAALFAPWMFGRAMPDIERLYRYSIGWGIVAEVIGGALLALIGGLMLLKRNRVSTDQP
jgi:hydrogenase/urease accessory protein HupE